MAKNSIIVLTALRPSDAASDLPGAGGAGRELDGRTWDEYPAARCVPGSPR